MTVSILTILAWRVDVPDALARLRSPAPLPLLLAALAIGAQWPVTALRAVSFALALGLVQLLTSLPGVAVLAPRRRRAAESLP